MADKEFNLTPMESVDGVDVYNICDLDPEWMLDWDQTAEAIKRFEAETDAIYYGACREDFSIFAGVELAKQSDKTAVIVEDLS